MIGLMLMLAAASGPDFYTSGNKLYADCQLPMSDAGQGRCMAYIQGVSDMIDVYKSAGYPAVCSSIEVTVGQARDVVLKHMRNNPETRDRSAASIVFLALAEAFPCPKKGG